MSFEIEPPLIQRKTAGSFFSKSESLKRFYINRLKKKFWPLSQQKKNEPLISESIEWIWNEISIQCLIIEAKEGGRRRLKGHSLFSRWVSIPRPYLLVFHPLSRGPTLFPIETSFRTEKFFYTTSPEPSYRLILRLPSSDFAASKDQIHFSCKVFWH